MRNAVHSLTHLPPAAMAWGGAFLIAFGAATLALFWAFPAGPDRTDIGSIFGAVGSFFGSLALLGVAWALKLQHEAAERDKERLSNDMKALQETLRLSALAVIAPWVEEQVKWHEKRKTLGKPGGQAMTELRTRLFSELETLAGLPGPASEQLAWRRALEADADVRVRPDKPASGSYKF